MIQAAPASRPRETRATTASRTALVIGASAAERVEVAVLGYAPTTGAEPHDAIRLAVEVEIAAGVFAGRFAASLDADAFEHFRAALARLHATLAGEAVFETVDAQLTLRLVGNGRAQLALSGMARHPLGDGNMLNFAFALDRTRLVEPLHQLDRIIAAFPSRA